jgi:Rod binding domain-containing protein
MSTVSTDLILDVINAADRAQSLAVQQKLADVARQPAGDNFARVLNGGAVQQQLQPPLTSANFRSNAQPLETQFEAMVLKAFVEAMLPQGSGLPSTRPSFASSVWRSSLADQIANGLATQSPFGIARHLAKSASDG